LSQDEAGQLAVRIPPAPGNDAGIIDVRRGDDGEAAQVDY
jgi:hypothetical protein